MQRGSLIAIADELVELQALRQEMLSVSEAAHGCGCVYECVITCN